MQIATIKGNVGKGGAELRSTGSTQVANFSVAVNNRRKKDAPATWWSCSLWGKQAEALSQHIAEGKPVICIGEFEKVERDGKTYLNMNVQNFEFAGGDRDSQPSGQQSGRYGQSGGGYGAGGQPVSDDDLDQIPFAPVKLI